MYTLDAWIDKGRPGYFGAKRDEAHQRWNQLYGKKNWTLGWKITPNVFTDYLGACAIYEDAYMNFMSKRPELVTDLITRSSNVYDFDPSDIESGLDYTAQHQSHGRTHVQDISIRRVLTRMGKWFNGPSPIQIRFHEQRESGPRIDRLSPMLTPGRVTFHLPTLLEPELHNPHHEWYNPDSVEAFYQFNKHLLVKK